MEGKFSNIHEWQKAGSYFRFRDTSIFYGTFGKGDPLLLLHGYPFNSYDWNWVLEEFSKQYQVVYLDFLGMGFSDKPEDHKYSFEEYVEIVNALVIHLKLKTVRVIAHDLAVSVVQEMISHQERLNFGIESIAFMNGGMFTDVYKPRFIQRLLSQTPDLIGSWISKKMSRKSIENSLEKVFGPKTQPDQSLREDYWYVLNYKSGKNIAYLIGRLVFEKVKYQSKWIQALKSTKIPFCYICGPYDPNSGTHMALRFKKEYPDAYVYFLSSQIGHWPQIESPKEVLSTYSQFQREVQSKLN